MAISPISKFLQNIRRAALRRDEAGLTDGQLLDAYVRSREEAAFATLLHRHGPMVLGVCRRVLGHVQDAEDAYQATFLALARHAGRITKREAVAGWLHKVAYRTALTARGQRARRNVGQKLLGAVKYLAVAPDAEATAENEELQRVLDQEEAEPTNQGQIPKAQAADREKQAPDKPDAKAPRAVLEIPDEALLSDQGKKYVFVVNEKNIVQRREVALGPADNDMRIIEKGLREEDWVVIAGLANIQPGDLVSPQKKGAPKRSDPRRDQGG